MSTTNLYVVNGLPTYGNWGGPGWTAGEQVPAGTPLTDAQKAVIGVNDLDRLFKAHDIAYDDAAKMADPLAEAKAILAADMQLMGGMWLSGQLSDPLAESYRNAAMNVFEAKIVWDVLQIGSGLLGQIPFIPTPISLLFNAARSWTPPRGDPLALDLDRDGIETIGANGTVLFDHDGDGVKTGTGWVSADDGLLVLDRNGNGQIDTGAELFGVDTVLANGQKASDGFAALRDLDANGDGVFNAQDARFADVRVWRDLNQNGASQAGELFTLQTLGITAINLNATAAPVNLGNGNVQTATATYALADGTTGATAGVGLGQTAANLEFALNPFYRQFTDPIPLTEQASLLPQMQGSGRVRDLREAASQSPALEAALTQYGAATTRGEQMALMDELLKAWADTSDMKIYQSGWYYSTFTGTNLGEFDRTYATIDGVESSTIPVNLSFGLNQTSETRFHMLEAFNGGSFSSAFQQMWGGGLGARISDSSVVAVSSTGQAGSDSSIIYTSINLAQPQTDLLDQAYDALKQSVYDGLVLQTRLKPYLDAVALQLDTSGLHLDFAGVTAALVSLRQTDAANALIDMIELHKMAGTSLYSLGWNELPTLRTWIEEAANDAALQNVLTELGVKRTPDDLGGTVWGTEGADLMLGQAGDDYLSGNGGNDLLSGGAGADTLQGGVGNDILDGGAGNDTLYGGSYYDAWYSYSTTTNGNDTYLFGRGSGQDTLSDYDATANNTDTIRFAADVAPSDITLNRDGSNLYLSINGTTDKLTVQNWFSEDAYRVEQVQFADGTVWDANYLASVAYTGTDAADTLNGTSQGETFKALGGDDALTGGEGDDTLDGGTGNDALDGGTGNDTYVFGRGSGQDTISDYDTTSGNIDTIRLAAGISASDVTLSRDASNLYLGINGASDKITVQSWFADPAYRVEQVQFADGTVWDASLLQAAKFRGTDAADYIAGTTGNDVIEGLGGDDSLTGGEGDDTLDGGTGNDALDGGTGNDTYLFGRGSGQDTISDYDATSGNIDTIRLMADISASDVTLSRDASNLYLGINGTSDKITVQNWFADPVYRVEQIEFADGTVWGVPIMQAAKLTGTESSDYLSGSSGDDVIEGLGGSDSLTGNSGNDTLDGGTGNDTLDGGTGNDTYVFGRGYGQDTISDYDATAGNIDSIRLAAGISASDVTLSRDASSLYLGINDTSDRIMVQSWFDDPAYRVEQVQFDDGTIWDAAKLQQTAVFLGTAGADALYGTAQDETIDGLGGDDYLAGSTGNDTYLFGRGSGQDTISDYDPTAGNIDTIRLAAGISASDVTLSRDASNLYLGINGTSDKITVQSWFDDPAYRVEQVQFADGTVWDAVLLQAAKFRGTDAADYLVGVAGNNNTVEGMGGDDTLLGDMGNDILDGGAGNDSLSDAAGNNLLMGKAGDDTLTGDAGNGLFIGGSGNDTITVGTGSNIIAFNRGDGQDVVNVGTGNDALSLGRGIGYTDLAFHKAANDLILDTGAGESITLKDWYAAPSSHGVVTLQVIAESMPGFDPQSVDTLLSQKVQEFDFAGLASHFDAAQVADPAMTSWNLMNGLLDAHLAGSDTASLGGDLAYQYGLNGSLTGIGLAAAQDVLAAPQFGSQAQALRPWSTLNSGTIQLS